MTTHGVDRPSGSAPRGLNAILRPLDAISICAMGATVERVPRLDAVANDGAATMRTARRKRMDGAFEAVEYVNCVVGHYLKGFVVVVAANFTLGHDIILRRFRPLFERSTKVVATVVPYALS
jgi:hypothetical protein